MSCRFPQRLLTLLIAQFVCAATLQAAEDPAATPLAISRSHQFALPVSLARKENSSVPFAATRLFVSRDEGKSWSVAATTPGDVDQIDVQANDDGHYWFAVRRLTARGQSFPEHAISPELHVLVDTTPPTLQIEARRVSERDVRIHVAAGDFALLPTSLELRYLSADPLDQWSTISLDERQLTMEDGRLLATVPLPITSPFELTIRASVWDRVGHKAVATTTVFPPAPVTASTTTSRDLTTRELPATPVSLPAVPGGLSPIGPGADRSGTSLPRNPKATPLPTTREPQRLAEPQHLTESTSLRPSPDTFGRASITDSSVVTASFPQASLLPAADPVADVEPTTTAPATLDDLALFEQLLARQANNAPLRAAYATALQSRQDYYHAELEWRKVLATAPDHADARKALARCLQAQKRYTEAGEILARPTPVTGH